MDNSPSKTSTIPDAPNLFVKCKHDDDVVGASTGTPLLGDDCVGVGGMLLFAAAGAVVGALLALVGDEGATVGPATGMDATVGPATDTAGATVGEEATLLGPGERLPPPSHSTANAVCAAAQMADN